MSLLIHSQPLIVLPELAVKIGLNEAIILQQIHYWQAKSQNMRDGRAWVYNSAVDWQEQFPFWSVITVRRALTELRNRGLVLTGTYNKAPRDKTLWYSIDYEHSDLKPDESPIYSKWVNGCTQNEQMGVLKMSKPLPETTQRVSTEKKPNHSSENRKQKTALPESFEPNDTCRKKAASLDLPIQSELEKFKDFHESKGNRYVDWQAAFRNWLAKAAEFRASRDNVKQFPQNYGGSDCGGKAYIPSPAGGGS